MEPDLEVWPTSSCLIVVCLICLSVLNNLSNFNMILHVVSIYVLPIRFWWSTILYTRHKVIHIFSEFIAHDTFIVLVIPLVPLFDMKYFRSQAEHIFDNDVFMFIDKYSQILSSLNYIVYFFYLHGDHN